MYEYEASFEQRMAIDAAASERLAFIRRTYLHVAGAIVAFAALLAVLVSFVPQETMAKIFLQSMSRGNPEDVRRMVAGWQLVETQERAPEDP